MEAFDFAFGPMKEPELDGLQKLTLTGKIFHVFSLQDWKSQLDQQKERILQRQRLLRQWEHDFVLSVHHSVSLLRRLQVQSLQWFLCEEF